MDKNLGQLLGGLGNVISQIDDVELKNQFAKEYVELVNDTLLAFAPNTSEKNAQLARLIFSTAGVAAITTKGKVEDSKLEEYIQTAIDDSSEVIQRLSTLGATEAGIDTAQDLQGRLDRIILDVFHYFDVKDGNKPLTSEELESIAEELDDRFDEMLVENKVAFTDEDVIYALTTLQASAAERLDDEKATEIINNITEVGVTVLGYTEGEAQIVREHISGALAKAKTA